MERRHRHIIDTALSMLKQAGLPTLYWDYVVQAATYIYNQNPTSLLQGKSSMQELTGRIPEYDKLWTLDARYFRTSDLTERINLMINRLLMCSWVIPPIMKVIYV